MNCIILQFIHFIGTWRLYKKSGRKIWEALLPIYSIWVMLKISHRPTWWIVLFFLPVISGIMYGILWVEFIYFFYKKTKKEKILVLITFGFYIMYINYLPKIKYRKIINFYTLNRNTAIFEAIILAICFHTYFIQPFIVPSTSMERTLLIGDFILVSKLHYGLHIPIIPIVIPILQRTIPLSYVKLPTLTMFKKDEIIVFNFPHDYLESSLNRKNFYIKRCIALPGDRLEIKEGKLHINGIKENKINKKQFSYIIKTKDIPLNKKLIKKKWKYNDIIFLKYEKKKNIYFYHIFLTEKYAKKLNTLKTISFTFFFKNVKKHNIFPKKKWNLDNYGPIYIPKKGDIIYISLNNIYKYKDIIIHYEENSLTKHGNFFLNGKESRRYSINNNYYFMLGDNRHNSLDSRYWGFLPENHIVGKPIFLLFSINWDRENPLYFLKWKLRFNRIMIFFD
jgi:signal peptidase I